MTTLETTMPEPQPPAPTITTPLPLAEPLAGPSSPAQITASSKLPTEPITAASPIFRDYTPTHLTPSSTDGGEPVRKSSRLKKEEVYDFNAPVVLHEYIEEKGMAVDEVLFAFGFAVCENDTMWYHPHAQFQCQSKGELYCKWRRGTILRCCITTEIIRTHETGVPVVDLEPLGSRYHPECVNDKCRWNNPKQMMRLEKGQLVTCELSSGQLFALRTKAKGKWFGPCQDVYPRAITSKPFSKDPTPALVDKRMITLSNTSATQNTDQPPVQDPPPISPESLPPSPAKPTVVTYGKRKRDKAGPSRRRSRPKPAPIATPDRDPTGTHDIDLEPAREEEEGFDADVTDGSVLKDHLIVSKRQYHRLETKIVSLEASLDQAAADLDAAQQEVNRQKSSAEGLETSTDRLAAADKRIGELEGSLRNLASDLEAATKQLDRQKGLAKDWNDVAQQATKVLAAAKEKMRKLEEKENVASKEKTAFAEDKAALEKENVALKAALAAEKSKFEEVVTRGKQFLEGLSK